MESFFNTFNKGLGFPEEESEDEEMKGPGIAGVLANGLSFIKAKTKKESSSSNSDSSDSSSDSNRPRMTAPKAKVQFAKPKKEQPKANLNQTSKSTQGF